MDKEELAEMEKVYKDCRGAAHMAFVDNHNAGYDINSYTTKLNPTMDNQLVCKKGEWTCHRMQISLPSKPSSALTRATRHDQHARRLRQSDPLRDATHDLKTCAYCLQEKPKMKKCAGCRWARYCNRGCQRAHWLLHRQTCCPDHCLPIGQLGILYKIASSGLFVRPL